MAREGPNRHISIPKSFSEGNTHEWFQRFEICCQANGWNDEVKALKLPTLLEGEALAVYSDSERENDSENGAHGVHIFGEVSETENVARRSDFIIPP